MSKVLNLKSDRDITAAAKIVGTKDFERFHEMWDSNTPATERLALAWRVTSNQIVRLRREARREIQTMRDLRGKKSELEKKLKVEMEKTFKNEFEIERMECLIRSQNELMKSTLNALATIGELVTDNLNLYSLIATDHDFAQLINANVQELARYRKEHEEQGDKDSSFFFSLIFVNNIEPEPEKPLYNALFHAFFREIERNDDLRKLVQEEVLEVLPGFKYRPKYVLYDDALGNRIAEQVYQPLELV